MTVLTLDHATLDLQRHEVLRDDEALPLTPLEASLLAYLADHPGRAVSRRELLQQVWEYPKAVRTRSVDHTVSRLRHKIERDPATPELLVSVRGVGYRLDLPDPPSQLPPAPPDLLGRDGSLARLEAAAETSPVVTITGTAGMGKTTLALTWAHRRAPHAVFVDLSTAQDAAAVVRRVAEALDIPLQGSDAADQVGRALEARERMLLLLDNAEQVADAAAEVVSRWRELAPEVRFLVTSRRRLAVPGEVVVPLPPLSEADGAELFARRAHHATVREASDDDLRALVRALDGMPLAIELAAARSGLLTVRQLTERLDARFRLLSSSAAGVALDVALQGSWDLLQRGTQQALARLSLFEGRFPLEGAEAVLPSAGPGEPWAVDLLERLREHHLLVRHEQPPRLGLLVSVRAFARQRLEEAEPDEQVAAASAHARWLVAHLSSAPHDAELASRYRLDALAAAHRVATSDPATACALLSRVEWVCRTTGFAPESTWTILRTSAASIPDLHAITLLLQAQAAAGQSWSEDGITLLERALTLAESAQVRARVRSRLGAFLSRTPRRAEASQHLHAVCDTFEAHGDRLLRGISRLNLGYLAFWEGRSAEARARMEDALDDFTREGVTHLRQHVLNTLVGVSTESDPPEVAAVWLDRAERLARRQRDEVAHAWVQATRAAWLDEQGDDDAALALACEALERARRHGAAWVEGPCVAVIALVQHQRGELVAAEQALDAATPIFEHFLDPATQALLLARRAALAAERQERGEARRRFGRALELAADAPVVRRAVEVLEGFELLAAWRRGDAADEALREHLARLDGERVAAPVRRHVRLLRSRWES